MPEISAEKLAFLENKADAFDRLVHDLASLLPLEARIKKLAGLPLLDALKGYRFVQADAPNPDVKAPPYQFSNPA